MTTAIDTETVFQAYVTCALWSSTDDNGEPLDGLYGPDDIAPDALKSMRDDVQDFIEGAGEDGIRFADEFGLEQLGHDFWLTRNRHGAGFWDRGAGELGYRLTAMAYPYGESYLYTGDDGLVYVS